MSTPPDELRFFVVPCFRRRTRRHRRPEAQDGRHGNRERRTEGETHGIRRSWRRLVLRCGRHRFLFIGRKIHYVPPVAASRSTKRWILSMLADGSPFSLGDIRMEYGLSLRRSLAATAFAGYPRSLYASRFLRAM